MKSLFDRLALSTTLLKIKQNETFLNRSFYIETKYSSRQNNFPKNSSNSIVTVDE